MRISAVLFFFLLGLGTVLVAQDRRERYGEPSQRSSDRRGSDRRNSDGRGGDEPRPFIIRSEGEPRPWIQQGSGGPPITNGGPTMPGRGIPPWGNGPPPWVQSDSGGRGVPPPTGSPPSNSSSGSSTDRTARMMEMFRSMDTNRNGILDPGEISDSRRGFVNAIVSRMGLDPNGPINLADLERRAMATANSASSGGSTPSSSRSSESGSTGRSPAPVIEPLVPPFGEKGPAETPVLEFGQRDAVAQTVQAGSTRTSRRGEPQSQPIQTASTATRQSGPYSNLSAEVRANPNLAWFFNADKDLDGQLTMQEYNSWYGGAWTPGIANEFKFLDRNGDGYATIAEILESLKEFDEKRAAEAAQGGGTPSAGDPPQSPTASSVNQGNPAVVSPESPSERPPVSGYRGGSQDYRGGQSSSSSQGSSSYGGRDSSSYRRSGGSSRGSSYGGSRGQ